MAKRAHISTLYAGNRSRRLAKQKPQRQVILIVCEGQTEEAYFRAIKQHYRHATTLNVEITRAHSDPVRVVKMGKLSNSGRDYDRVYCVVDGDKPDRIELARKHIGTRDDLDLIVSVPCFEVWLLLHFERSDAPITACAQACDRLREPHRLPDYAKGLRYDFMQLTALIDTAIDNAEWLATRGLDSPATGLHRLLTRIRPAP